jgi:hypothetical protein
MGSSGITLCLRGFAVASHGAIRPLEIRHTRRNLALTVMFGISRVIDLPITVGVLKARRLIKTRKRKAWNMPPAPGKSPQTTRNSKSGKTGHNERRSTMETETLTFDRIKARELWRAYRTHQHYAKPIDQEIARTYHLIAQGRLMIRAIDSIIKAGLDEQGLPKLAIVRADAEKVFWRPEGGGGSFAMENRGRHWARSNEHASRRITIPDNSWPNVARPDKWSYEAITPLIPLNLRPKRGLENYHVLWEAEWQRRVPVDPMLLRRIGAADIWLVVCAWDLTEVERTALAARLHA